MKQFAISILFFALCGIGCKSKPDVNVNSVIAACIKATIGSGDSAKMAYRFSRETPSIMPDSERVLLQARYDSIKHMLDTAHCFITLADTLGVLTVQQHEEVPVALKAIAAKYADTGFCKWNIKQTQRVDTSYLAQTLHIPVEIDSRVKSYDIRHIASFWFSNIAFNEKKNKAAVYMEYACGGKCGYTTLMILEQESGNWKVVANEKTMSY